MNTVIWWIRRDLRLADNPALQACLKQATSILPVFVLDPALIDSPNTGEHRLAFLYGGLRQLHSDLMERGSRLILRQGRPAPVLKALLQESGAEGIYAEADTSPYALKRDEAVRAELPLERVGSASLSPPEAVLKDDGSPYTVFTPYMRAWKRIHHPSAGSLVPAPEAISTPGQFNSDPLPEIGDPDGILAHFPPGEGTAQERLAQFSKAADAPIFHYGEQRNRMDLAGTSQLSPYLRFGMLSARAAIATAYQALSQAAEPRGRKGAETWLNELIWREFYTSILYHFPNVLQGSFRQEYNRIRWQNDRDEFQAWCQGRTGYPTVDAAMRQLAGMGWMHNRARMIVASFLVKDLLIDWRWGERWFMQQLVDGDPAANNGGWQWTAGTGTDAAPYFRIFNPILQGKKFDPEGSFTRRWLPELREVPQKYLHTPWEMPPEIQKQCGCRIGVDYPVPTVDHAFARQRTLEAFKAAKESSSS
jgi:deoxyribodipyrimidine photo-lyase